MIAFIAGTVSGIISSWGIGGGTLLMVFMTAFAKIPQQIAQGINLLYFLPTSGAAIVSHIKNGYVNKKAALCAICAGVITAPLLSVAATAMNTNVLKKLFGAFLIIIGTSEFFHREKKTGNK